jgi:hypothetical protein
MKSSLKDYRKRFLSLCGCGGFCGTTRLVANGVAFWVLLVFLCVFWCGSGVFCHMLHRNRGMWVWRHAQYSLDFQGQVFVSQEFLTG